MKLIYKSIHKTDIIYETDIIKVYITLISYM